MDLRNSLAKFVSRFLFSGDRRAEIAADMLALMQTLQTRVYGPRKLTDKNIGRSYGLVWGEVGRRKERIVARRTKNGVTYRDVVVRRVSPIGDRVSGGRR